MQKITLVGNGFVGKNVSEKFKSKIFSSYTSSNIHDSLSLSHDLVVSAAPSAKKWLANKNPEQDFASCKNLVENVLEMQKEWLFHFSTIDVYAFPGNSPDEDCQDFSSTPYGKNRRWVEEQFLSSGKCTIVRLPAVFGPHLSKNYLFDLMNDNNISSIKANSEFQWLHIKRSFDLIENCKSLPQIINLAIPPVNTFQLIRNFFPQKLQLVDTQSEGSRYCFVTKHSPKGFIMSEEEMLKDLKDFVMS